MAENAQTKSSIPIGVLNMDEGKEGEELFNRIKQIPTFYVYEGTQKSLDRLLKEDLVQAVFIIKKGYEANIKSGKTNNLVTLQYKENNSAVKILSDIFAGEMLKNICLYKGYLSYENAFLKNGQQIIEGTASSPDTLDQYIKYIEDLEHKSDTFTFDIKVIDMDTKIDISGRLDNSLLYLQILSGILTMFISLFGLYVSLPLVMDMEVGIRKRIEIGGVNSRNLFTLDLCFAGVGSGLLLCFDLFICVCFYFTVPGLTVISLVEFFILFMLYSVTAVLGFIILGNLAGKVRRYERLGITIALIFGILGIGSTFSGIMNGDLLNLSKLIPNSWFIREFIDIILNTGLQDTQYMQFLSLGITGFSLLGILWLMDKFSLNNWRNVT
jgi:hypothetical protein